MGFVGLGIGEDDALLIVWNSPDDPKFRGCS